MELLIVIVILAILAAAIIPQFTDISSDAKASTADINVRVLRGKSIFTSCSTTGSRPLSRSWN